MKQHARTLVGLAVAGALTLPLGVSLAGAQEDPSQPAPTQPAPTQPAPTQPAPTQPAATQPTATQPGPGTSAEARGSRRPQRRGHRGQALAAALGVSVDELKAALKTVREHRPAEPITDPAKRREHRTQQLAEALGLTTEQVTEAVATAAGTRVDRAVASGKITQEEGDRIHEAIAAGDGSARDVIRETLSAHRGERLPERLAAAVSSGRITQAQADEISRRVAAGERPRKVLREVLRAG